MERQFSVDQQEGVGSQEKRPRNRWRLFGPLGVSLVAIFVVLAILTYQSGLPNLKPPVHAPTVTKPSKSEASLEKFKSAQEFKTYLEKVQEGAAGLGMLGMGRAVSEVVPQVDLGEPLRALEEAAPKAGGEAPERVSKTTVQVAGIDEPDMVKTDGEEIYFSPTKRYRIRPLPAPLNRERVGTPAPQPSQTKVIRAFPPSELAEDAEVEKAGNLLLSGQVLVIFSGSKIHGYDVSNPRDPKKEWDVELESKNRMVGARLYKGKIYLVTQTQVSPRDPCPLKPLTANGVPLNISCTDIYHPATNIQVDVTFTALSLDPQTGEVEDKVSFVGSSGSSVIYVSPQAIYATYSYYESMLDFLYKFLEEEAADLVPSSVTSKIKKLADYDISDAAKMTELRTILERWQSSLDDDERLRVENELTNRMQDYYQENKRELEKTGIAKVDLDGLDVAATGSVPGTPLNQFSLDEYKDNLRVAITVGGGVFGRGESVNDVYVLDQNLDVLGSVKDMGIDERIYSVRFIEDKGYVVTFKQIDPFFVLDLSTPYAPKLKGKLKIPGYSSYLHPITKDKILGIGKEEGQVKISLFDVSNAENPIEADKYLMEERWSDISNTHHAFLLDKKHGVFFLPGSQGGYVFSYEGDELKMEKAVSGTRARRAIYLDDYLYIIGDDKITVLNETDWTEVNELEF